MVGILSFSGQQSTGGVFLPGGSNIHAKFSQQLNFKDFEQCDLTRDLQLDLNGIFTLGW